MNSKIQFNSLPVVWFTGLSGAGKTTIAQAVGSHLKNIGASVEVLDADKLRQDLSMDLGFTSEDRKKNVRRISALADTLNQAGNIVLVACIAPYRQLRAEIRASHPLFIEVFVNAPLAVCERRDVKGLYAKARRGEITEFTGISAPYEPPLAPEVECRTDTEPLEVCCAKVIQAIGMEKSYAARLA